MFKSSMVKEEPTQEKPATEELERQIQPVRTASNATPTSQKGKTYSNADIQKMFQKAAQLSSVGKLEQANKLEAEIDAAYMQGRVCVINQSVLEADMAAVYPVTGSGSFDTNPSYSGAFIPTLWSVNCLPSLHQNTILSEVCNTDYEGELQNQGDTVRIRTAPQSASLTTLLVRH